MTDDLIPFGIAGVILSGLALLAGLGFRRLSVALIVAFVISTLAAAGMFWIVLKAGRRSNVAAANGAGSLRSVSRGSLMQPPLASALSAANHSLASRAGFSAARLFRSCCWA